MAADVNLSKILTDKVIVSAAVLVLVALGLMGRTLLDGSSTRGKGNANPLAYTHLRCATCGDQIAYSPELVGMTCEVCDRGAAYTPVVDLQAAKGTKRSWGKIGAFGISALVFLLSLTHLIILRVRHLRHRAAEVRNPTLLAQCPFCNRKITYSTTRAGTAWVCSQCKTAFLLPSPA